MVSHFVNAWFGCKSIHSCTCTYRIFIIWFNIWVLCMSACNINCFMSNFKYLFFMQWSRYWMQLIRIYCTFSALETEWYLKIIYALKCKCCQWCKSFNAIVLVKLQLCIFISTSKSTSTGKYTYKCKDDIFYQFAYHIFL